MVDSSHGCAMWGGAIQGAGCAHALEAHASDCFALRNVYVEFRNIGSIAALSSWAVNAEYCTGLVVESCRVSVQTLAPDSGGFVPRRHIRLHRCNQSRVVANVHYGQAGQGDELLRVESSVGVIAMVDGAQMSAASGEGSMVDAAGCGVVWIGGAYGGGQALGQQVAIRTPKPATDGTDFQTGT